jgi:hypothetical protein
MPPTPDRLPAITHGGETLAHPLHTRFHLLEND